MKGVATRRRKTNQDMMAADINESIASPDRLAESPSRKTGDEEHPPRGCLLGLPHPEEWYDVGVTFDLLASCPLQVTSRLNEAPAGQFKT
jgi:hypothetical protein